MVKEGRRILMARFSYTVYKNSVLATIISFLSRMITMLGIVAAIVGVMDGEFVLLGVGAAIFVVFGIGGTALAEIINTYQSNIKWWKNSIVKPGWKAKIPNSVDVCFQVYNANPCQWTLNQIQKLNPSAAAQIQQSLASKQ